MIGTGGPNDGPTPVQSIFDHLIDGVTAASIVTLVAYAIVFGFEEGFNTFFQIPADYVATNFLSVFHVLTLVVFTIVHDALIALCEIGVLLVLLVVPARIFATRVWTFALTSVVLYSFSNILQAPVLLAGAAAVCIVVWRLAGGRGKSRTRLVARVGDRFTKAVFIFVLLLTPLFCFGFRYAESQNPRLVLHDGNATWVLARILNGEFILIGLQDGTKPALGCTEQFPSRLHSLSRTIRIVKEDGESPLQWQQFDEPLGYCIFDKERMELISPAISAFVFLRQGPQPAVSEPTPRARPTATASR